MTSNTEALPRTSVASICWGSVNIRNYWQDKSGGIRETQWGGSWTGGTSKNVITRAKLTSPLAAIQWSNAGQIRVYYLDSNNIIQEYMWNGSSWSLGSLGSKGIVADPDSKLAAIVWGGPNIRIYYQKPKNSAIHEHCYGPSTGWTAGATLPAACPGSGLAAVYWDGHIRVYYQAVDNRLREHCWDGSWTVGAFNFEAPFSTAISAISWTSAPQIRVYFTNKSNELVEAAWTGKWNTPGKITDLIPSSSIASICWDNIQIRLYFQRPQYEIQEWVYSGGWGRGATIPTRG